MPQFLDENDLWRQVARFQRNEETMIRNYKRRIREIIDAVNHVRQTNRARPNDNMYHELEREFIDEEKQRFHTAMNRVSRAMLGISYEKYLAIKRNQAPLVFANPDGSYDLAFRRP